MKKIILFLFAGLMAVSCQNKDLGEVGPKTKTRSVEVVFDWLDKPSNEIPTTDGMRVNIFAIEDDVRDYGVDDIAHTGGTVNLLDGRKYRTLSYTYRGNNIYFRNESDQQLIEAYCNVMTRSTYSRTYPQENTYSEPQGLFYTGENGLCHAIDGACIDITPESRIYKYTFEVRGIKGAEFIRETRGAISGMSSSYLIGQNMPSQTVSTLLFQASVDKDNGKITGTFRTFGRLNTNNNFTVEILFPSNAGGILQRTWDVTDQIDDNDSFHILIEDSGIEVPDESGEDASGWDIDLAAWNDTDVELN